MLAKLCIGEAGCPGTVVALDLCMKHYQRLRRYGNPNNMATKAALLWLARCELGAPGRVYPVTPLQVQLLRAEKRLAQVEVYEPTAWMFDARRTALGEVLCQPGAAATARTPGAALEAALTLLSQYRQAVRHR